MFSINLMTEEHPTFKRLFEIAKSLDKDITQADIARFFNVPDQNVANWKSRGIPKDKIIDLSDEWGFRPKFVKDGVGEMFFNRFHLLQAQEKALLEIRDKLPEYAREEMISDAIRKAELIAKAQATNKPNGTHHQ